ncbi:hypothetical protein RZS28_06780 [Methylocapsa polymorpha]|uniref:FAD/NAD(P)-binding domain-containing protein n=1 Tax=Methylocapsa polymorpha TaxID=3080828 RepID=A0ABZ0HWR1_9HYPH|nr:hypothetical protein RZS28_06780 [Methylocapsa sp. RX1]
MKGLDRAHHIVIIGRGADGFVLAARLGRTLGRSGWAAVTLVVHSTNYVFRPVVLEVAAHISNAHVVNAVCARRTKAQFFQFRLGRINDVDRVKREITFAPVVDEQGREIIPARRLEYDTLILESPQHLFEVMR